MDRGNFSTNIKQEKGKRSSAFSPYIIEGGKRYRMPYRTVERVVFSNLKREELVDIQHAARLQYRLMLLNPIIKAAVDFTKVRITIIYNPKTADNINEKISLEELVQILVKEGVHTDPESTTKSDYDYKEFYSYAYNPPTIKENPPYGYTMEEWEGMKLKWERKMKKLDVKKREKFRQWQENYLNANPDIASKIVEGYKPKDGK